MNLYDIKEFDEWFEKLQKMVEKKQYSTKEHEIELILSKLSKFMDQLKIDLYKDLLERK